MAYTNGSGQTRVGVRVPGVAPVVTTSTLLTSLYSVWNGETAGTSLDSSIFGAWNGEKNGTSLDSGIVGAWHGENNVNDSVGTNHGTAVGGLTYSTGKIGQSFNFNGSSCVDLGDIMDIGTKNWSYSMWIKTNVVSGFTTIFSKAMTESFGGRFGILTSNNFIKVFFDPTGSNTITADSSTSILTNTWYHLVFQIDRSDKLKLYINGVFNNLVTKDGVNNLAPYVSSDYNRPTTFKLGAYTNTNGTPTQFFNGQIDAFSVWDRLLTADEVTQLYNAGNGTQYPFSTQTLPSSIDSVGTNHGTLQSGMSMDLGKIGSAFKSNGTSNAYLTLTDNSLYHTTSGDFSISLWVKFASMSSPATGGQQYPISYMSSTTNGWYILNGSTFRIANGTTNVDLNASAMTAGVWRHIVITRKYGTRTRFYVDGVLSNSNTSTINPSSGTFFPTIGAYRSSSSASSGYCTNGTLIDAVTTWSKELSEDEVVQLYNGGNGTQYPFGSQTLPSVANQFGVDNGNPVGGLTFTNGLIGKAFTGNGTNAYVQLPNNSCNFTGDFSINMWFNLATTSVDFDLFANVDNLVGNTRSYGYRILYSGVSSLIRVHIYGSSEVIIDSPYTSSTNNWVMVTFIRKASTGSKVYINGSLISSNTSVVNPLYTGTFAPCIGAIKSVTSGYLAKFLSNGSKIDSVNVWQKELTQAEVTELYNSGNGKQLTVDTKIVTSGLVLNLDPSRSSSYPNSGTTWFDISGNGNNGTLTNGPVFGTASGGVISFDGVNDFVKIPLNLSSYSQVTVEIWYKINPGGSNLASWGGMLWEHSSDWNTNGGGFGLSVNSGGCSPDLNYMHTNHNGGSGPMNYQYNSGTTWSCHVNIFSTIADPTGRLVYVNGQLTPFVSTNTCNGGAWSTSTATTTSTAFRNDFLYLSSRNGQGAFINGNIGLIRIYGRKLSATEITQNFNATKSRFGL